MAVMARRPLFPPSFLPPTKEITFGSSNGRSETLNQRVRERVRLERQKKSLRLGVRCTRPLAPSGAAWACPEKA